MKRRENSTNRKFIGTVSLFAVLPINYQPFNVVGELQRVLARKPWTWTSNKCYSKVWPSFSYLFVSHV